MVTVFKNLSYCRLIFLCNESAEEMMDIDPILQKYSFRHSSFRRKQRVSNLELNATLILPMTSIRS